jgi:hypothetical protein
VIANKARAAQSSELGQFGARTLSADHGNPVKKVPSVHVLGQAEMQPNGGDSSHFLLASGIQSNDTRQGGRVCFWVLKKNPSPGHLGEGLFSLDVF